MVELACFIYSFSIDSDPVSDLGHVMDSHLTLIHKRATTNCTVDKRQAFIPTQQHILERSQFQVILRTDD